MPWYREPVVHFVAIGAAIFAVDAARRRTAPRDAREDRRIVVPASYVAAQRKEWLRRTGRPPDADGERRIVDDFVREEVLYREGLRLGLDRGDPIVRRRVVQKMRFLSEDLGPIPEPGDADLRAYLEARAEKYVRPARVRLVHVYFGRQRRGDRAVEDARRALAALVAGRPPPDPGDPFPRGADLPPSTREEVERAFGPGFARAVFAVAPGAWSGPVESSYGWHAVRVVERADARPGAFEDVRERLREDVVAERRAADNGRLLRDMAKRYDVRVEGRDAVIAGGSP